MLDSVPAAHAGGEGLAELAHDARNMVTALSLYCDLLEEPGVLAAAHRHYAGELRLVADASRRLVEKLSRLDGRGRADTASARQGRPFRQPPEPAASGWIDIREELLACRNLLAAIAGPAIRLTVTANARSWPVSMAAENLVRALVNLVRNSAEAIAGPGTIELSLDEQRDGAGVVRAVVLVVEDSGPGVPKALLEKVFEAGFSTRRETPGRNSGLGLAITRSIVEEAGGSIHAENRIGDGKPAGGRLVMEFPVQRGAWRVNHERDHEARLTAHE